MSEELKTNHEIRKSAKIHLRIYYGADDSRAYDSDRIIHYEAGYAQAVKDLNQQSK